MTHIRPAKTGWRGRPAAAHQNQSQARHFFWLAKCQPNPIHLGLRVGRASPSEMEKMYIFTSLNVGSTSNVSGPWFWWETWLFLGRGWRAGNYSKWVGIQHHARPTHFSQRPRVFDPWAISGPRLIKILSWWYIKYNIGVEEFFIMSINGKWNKIVILFFKVK